MMSDYALLFPGQGSQYPGMGKDLYRAFEEARISIDEASEAAGRDIGRLCFEGSREELDLTVNTQTAVFAVDMAAFRVFEKHCAVKPLFMAGHSLGEYAALTASGALPQAEMIRLVTARATFMQEAVPAGHGAMAAVMGLEVEDIERLCREAVRSGSSVSPANYNGPGQVVVSGVAHAVDELVALAKNLGGRAMKLPVSVPCHSDLLNTASERLGDRLSTLTFRDCSVPVIPNCDPKQEYKARTAGALLARQLTAPVRWQETIERMVRSGVKTVIELGPKRTLSGLAKRIAPELETLNVEDRASLEKTIARM